MWSRAEILDWKVREGELVKEDQILVELLTDKAEIEIPSPYSGRVERICFQVGEIAPVGAVLIEIDEDGSGPGVTVPAPTDRVEPAAVPQAPPTVASRAAHPPAMPERPRSQQKASERPGREGVDAVPCRTRPRRPSRRRPDQRAGLRSGWPNHAPRCGTRPGARRPGRDRGAESSSGRDNARSRGLGATTVPRLAPCHRSQDGAGTTHGPRTSPTWRRSI